jgi:hypothetical protein
MSDFDNPKLLALPQISAIDRSGKKLKMASRNAVSVADRTTNI